MKETLHNNKFYDVLILSEKQKSVRCLLFWTEATANEGFSSCLTKKMEYEITV